MGKGVVVVTVLIYLYAFMYPSIDSDVSKSNIQIPQHCPRLNVLPIIIFISSLSFACHLEFKKWMSKIGFIHASSIKGDSSNCRDSLHERTQGRIEIGLQEVHCRRLDGHHKVLQKLQVCHRLLQMDLLKMKYVY